MKINILFLSLVFFFNACSSSKPVTASTPEETKQAILSNRWIFVAQSVNPQGGRTQIINGRYEIRTSKDTVNAYLPYFGKSYSGAGAMTNANPMDFKSTNFSIEQAATKKGGMQVTIRPKDYNPVQTMLFLFYDNGSASLTVTLADRSPISYNGRVEPMR